MAEQTEKPKRARRTARANPGANVPAPNPALNIEEGERAAQAQLERSMNQQPSNQDFSMIDGLQDEDAGNAPPPLVAPTQAKQAPTEGLAEPLDADSPQWAQWNAQQQQPDQQRPALQIDPNVQRSGTVRRPDNAPTNFARVEPRADKDPDRPGVGPAQFDRLTQRLGATWFRSDAILDWAKYRTGFHMKFSRFYKDQRVLVDYFRAPSVAVEREVAEKMEAIAAYNSRAGEEKIGYVSMYLGDEIDDNTLNAARAGEMFAPPIKPPSGNPFVPAR